MRVKAEAVYFDHLDTIARKVIHQVFSEQLNIRLGGVLGRSSTSSSLSPIRKILPWLAVDRMASNY